ncbi:unnamed protein product [Aspergillus oryzae var. brunneus]|uniref:Carboxylic ester hydrolase n=1 Tax=Aspergillus oryzae var. brunneus TaxID=332754 RepID=A0ABQ6KKU2_ASPOZ|nr:unnamed protein product [Aspergillus oryzae]GMG42843.1 unnamed protein product [Aspergillus oryzae var. brunneus]
MLLVILLSASNISRSFESAWRNIVTLVVDSSASRIRYAAPPINELRWQPPVAPARNASHILPAVDQPPVCPQTGAAATPAVYGFNSGPGDEDCLYLNVYAPPEASDLPVFVWIPVYDPSPLINTNNNGFITVEIQYRLGVFGFLSSAEVHERGTTNAGLLDQRFALQWVQQHIAKFGGNPRRVTIGGESAGAGAAMLHSLAYGGEESNLFQNIIAASPYSVPIYPYDDPVPTGYYEEFVEKAGCGPSSIAKVRYNSSFDCLVAAPSETLQNASGLVSESGLFGTFAFLPVIDNDLIRERPSAQLLSGKVSGQRILVGPTDDSPRFDTLGTSGPTAKNESEVATGLQQTVFNIFAESTFDCPAQWLAEAFGGPLRQAWKYQYSVTPAYHGADMNAYFPAGASWPSKGFNHAFQKIWGSFIINDSPIIPLQDATANQSHAIVPETPHGTLDWPQFHPSAPWHMDLNTTGGTVSPVVVTPNYTYYIRQGNDIVNHFRLANAYTWEGGRGVRCLFWRAVADRIPL